MEIKTFLESCPIGKEVELALEATPRNDYLNDNRRYPGGLPPSGWIVRMPRISIFCNRCGGNRNFNPADSYPLITSSLDLGKGPSIHKSKGGKDIEIGRHADQFLRFICGDCTREQKKYSLSVEILNPLPDPLLKNASVKVRLTKFGEIPKPIKPINNRIKRLIKNEWELYRKGADDEAAGNGIGAFVYYRRVVEASRDLIIDAMCSAAAKLNVSEEAISEIQATKTSRNFTESINKVDHLFPSELKFNNQNALTVLYGPLSVGLHEKSDEECLHAAAVSFRQAPVTFPIPLLNIKGQLPTQEIDRDLRIPSAGESR